MKNILKIIAVNFLTLLLISKLTGGIDFSENYLVLFWAALSLSLLNFLVKPILNLLLMPINFLTLGASRWIINIVVFFLITLFIPEFKIVPITFPQLSLSGFSVPNITLSFFWSLFLVSFLSDLMSGLIIWILK